MQPDLKLSNVIADISSVMGKTSPTGEESQGVSVHAGASTCVCVGAGGLARDR